MDGPGDPGPEDEGVTPDGRVDAVDDVADADADADVDAVDADAEVDDFDVLADFDDVAEEAEPDLRGGSARPPMNATRLVAGLAFLVLGIIAVFLAVRAITDDTSETADAPPGASETTAANGPADDPGTSAPAPAGWPASVQGRPAALGSNGPPPADAGDLAPGWYLWSDFSDWHLWLVGGEGTDAAAVVTTNDKLTLKDTYGGAGVEATDTSAVVRPGADPAPIEGIDFNPGFFGDELTITITGDLPLRTGQSSVEAASPLTLRLVPQS
jgi:hypothetical protein